MDVTDELPATRLMSRMSGVHQGSNKGPHKSSTEENVQ